ncbi:mitochondrial inner membrane protein OXA1L-like [Ylistrum balloti]|uniref:mitochondrial inner membrane protein OXA1L-like n=1 Tax=Ylistrum balloti TaxID=509963 RepID=UPI002905A597|nr:mitochondrial inner membrane protein OXA1L-like [Ylistrum balloti]
MAALRHVRFGCKSNWINLFAGQASFGHFNENTGADSALNSIQKRWFHPSNFKKFHATGPQNRLLSTGLISSHYGVSPTWSVISAQRQRYNSTDASKVTPDSSGYILEPPNLPDVAEMTQQAVNALGEPTLASMGLGSYYPPGLYQQGLEFLHVGIGMPWWEAILLSTVTVRLLSLPLLVMSQRFLTNHLNNAPQLTRLQDKMNEAKLDGNDLEFARAQIQLQKFMKKTKTNPLKTMVFPLVQMPIFVSIFIGLRKMAYYPVESMSTGGLWWFTDLTVSDPYFILPILTSATLLLSIELGSDGISSKTSTTAARYFMRGVPIVMIPIMMTFPAALNGYWLTSNVCGLVLTTFLRQEYVRTFFKIPKKIKHPVKEADKKPFKQIMKDALAESRRKKKAKNRVTEKKDNFKKAGAGPLTKTYATDPTLKKNIKQRAH